MNSVIFLANDRYTDKRLLNCTPVCFYQNLQRRRTKLTVSDPVSLANIQKGTTAGADRGEAVWVRRLDQFFFSVKNTKNTASSVWLCVRLQSVLCTDGWSWIEMPVGVRTRAEKGGWNNWCKLSPEQPRPERQNPGYAIAPTLCPQSTGSPIHP